MRTKRKDNFVHLFVTIWLFTNSVIFCIFGIENVWIPNTIAIIVLSFILLNKKIMAWFNRRT